MSTASVRPAFSGASNAFLPGKQNEPLRINMFSTSGCKYPTSRKFCRYSHKKGICGCSLPVFCLFSSQHVVLFLPNSPNLRNPKNRFIHKMLPNISFLRFSTQGGLELLTIVLLTLKKLRRAGGTFRDGSEADWKIWARVLARRD